MSFNNIFTGTLLAAGISNGAVQGSSITMDRPATSMHLSFEQSTARNAARVNVMNSGCALDTTTRAYLDFNTLRELQFNATNSLDISPSFLKNREDKEISIKYLHRNQLIDVFSMDQNEILACLPPKAGTTNWQRYFAGLLDDEREPEDFDVPEVFGVLPRVLKSTKSQTVSELVDEYEQFTKMVNTRHPFARLVSAWRQKFSKDFWNDKKFLKKFGRKIAQFDDEEVPETHHFSFMQFVQYVANDSMDNYDYHWQSIAYQCLPCRVKYDVIVHQETSASDAEFFTEYKELNGTTHLPGQYVDSPLLSSSLVDHFQGMPRSLIEKLYQIYYDDFLLFNYSIDEFIEVADHTM